MIHLVEKDNSFIVDSKSSPGDFHRVRYDRDEHKFRCTCTHFALFPFSDTKICRHIQEATSYCIRRARDKQKAEQKLERELVLP